MLLRKNVINDGVTKEALPTKVNITTTQMFNKSTCKYFTLLLYKCEEASVYSK